MRAAVEAALRFHAMADDLAAAVFADWRELMNCALEAVEDVPLAGSGDFKGHCILVTANFTSSHFSLLGLQTNSASSAALHPLQPVAGESATQGAES